MQRLTPVSLRGKLPLGQRIPRMRTFWLSRHFHLRYFGHRQAPPWECPQVRDHLLPRNTSPATAFPRSLEPDISSPCSWCRTLIVSPLPLNFSCPPHSATCAILDNRLTGGTLLTISAHTRWAFPQALYKTVFSAEIAWTEPNQNKPTEHQPCLSLRTANK